MPGSSGARTIGITVGTGTPAGLPRSARVRNSGAGVAGGSDSVGGDGWGAVAAGAGKDTDCGGLVQAPVVHCLVHGFGSGRGTSGGRFDRLVGLARLGLAHSVLGSVFGSILGAASGAGGELSCVAGSGVTTGRASRAAARPDPSFPNRSRRGAGAASIASSNGEDSMVVPLSDGRLATGVCHWKASSRPVTGDTGRQRSLT